MDLDRFNVINDSLGHAAGDLLLIEVAKRIKTLIGESDTVSRLGGDEFAIILDNIKSIDDVKAIANNILHNTSKPCFINDKEVSVGISIGIAIAPMDESTVEGMVRKADAAMYYAKETGRGKFSFYSEEIEKRTKDVLEMQIKLRTALAKNEFSLYLQPQMAFNGRNFEIVGAEALIRWITTDGVIYTPDKFIPVAESNGMITSIGNWVLEEIFRIDKLLKENDINLKLAINVSVKQFENGNFVENLKRVLKENHNQNINLVIEITESMFIHDIQNAIEALLEIKKLGAQIALDDFGTGFSSLSYLTRLPIDYLKIDKSFVDNIGSTEHKDLTSSIISMAKTLGVKTVAEGVETKEQIEKLIVDGGTELQGYYFSKPLAFEEFIKFAKKN
jgi:diguanylate cyclase (GGDEF)-like protein